MPAAVNPTPNLSTTHRFAVPKYALLALVFRSQRRQAAQIEALMADLSALHARLDAAGEVRKLKPPSALP